MKLEEKMVSPDMASALLTTNAVNRPVSGTRVLFLANEMRTGNWKQNGETIVVSKAGKLLDGQHRLYAVMEFGAPVKMAIIYGADDDSFATIDTGRARTPQDIVAMAGHQYGAVLAPTAAALWRVWHRLDPTIGCPAHYVLAVIDRFPIMNKWAHFIHAKHALPPAASLLALVYLDDIAQKPGTAERFLKGMTTGSDLPDGDPVLALRNRAMNMRAAGHRLTIRSVWGGVVRCVDAIERGELIQKLAMDGSSGGYFRAPALWDAHIQDRPKHKRLDDLLPQTQGVKKRAQLQEFVREVRDTAASAPQAVA